MGHLPAPAAPSERELGAPPLTPRPHAPAARSCAAAAQVPLIWLLGLCFVASLVRRAVCPQAKGKARCISYLLLIPMAGAGLLGAGCSVLVYLDHQTYAAFVGMPTISVCFGVSLFMVLSSLEHAPRACIHTCILMGTACVWHVYTHRSSSR